MLQFESLRGEVRGLDLLASGYQRLKEAGRRRLSLGYLQVYLYGSQGLAYLVVQVASYSPALVLLRVNHLPGHGFQALGILVKGFLTFHPLGNLD